MRDTVVSPAGSTLLSFLAALVVGCGNSAIDKSDGGDGDGGPPNCHEQQFDTLSVAPNMMLVVDRSGSMNDAISAVSSRTKLQDVKDAVGGLLDYAEGRIRFGWQPFPADTLCNSGAVLVGASDHSVADIRQAIYELKAEGGTPTGQTLLNADVHPSLVDSKRPNFVVLITDGVPTCPSGNGQSENEQDSQLALDAVHALHGHGVDTYVIGLGESFNTSNPQLLSDMAQAGGRARPQSPSYYRANSLAELQAALGEIGKSVVSCHYSLNDTPDYPAYLWVFFDNEKITRDQKHFDGWDYDPLGNQINFFGSICDRLRTGQVGKVEVKMGCAPPT